MTDQRNRQNTVVNVNVTTPAQPVPVAGTVTSRAPGTNRLARP